MAGYVTRAHFGSVMVSQWRYAFSRHSSSHSGSPFLPEMRRTTSSERPAGMLSVSMSVTKPCWYSCCVRVSRTASLTARFFLGCVHRKRGRERRWPGSRRERTGHVRERQALEGAPDRVVDDLPVRAHRAEALVLAAVVAL